MSKLEIEVHNYVGFTNEGYVEHAMFIGNSDFPDLQKVVKLEDMVLEFIEMRQVNGKIADYHAREKTNLMMALEDCLALLKQA